LKKLVTRLTVPGSTRTCPVWSPERSGFAGVSPPLPIELESDKCHTARHRGGNDALMENVFSSLTREDKRNNIPSISTVSRNAARRAFAHPDDRSRCGEHVKSLHFEAACSPWPSGTSSCLAARHCHTGALSSMTLFGKKRSSVPFRARKTPRYAAKAICSGTRQHWPASVNTRLIGALHPKLGPGQALAARSGYSTQRRATQ